MCPHLSASLTAWGLRPEDLVDFPTRMSARASGIPLGPYLRSSRIAAGGMGEVFVATRTGPGSFERPIALKLLLPNLSQDESAVRLFLQEARLAGQLSHPNIVSVLDVGVDDGRYYLAMELVRGVSLSSLLHALQKSEGKLTSAMLSHIGRSVCQALDYAFHASGRDGTPLHLVHRDVSPHNVLLSEFGEVKLTDFGIARSADSISTTQTGEVRGKADYLAPELFAGTQGSHGTDVYALCVTLLHAALLQSPFRRDTFAATFEAVRTAPVPDLRALRPDLDPLWIHAIEKGASKAPEHRWQTSRELRDALPEKPPGTEETLGLLVRTLCPHPLNQLQQEIEAVTRSTVEAPGTHPVEEGRVPAASLPRPRATRRVWGGLAMAAMLAVGAGIGFQRFGPVSRPAEPTAPPTAPQTSPIVTAPVDTGASPTPVPLPNPPRHVPRKTLPNRGVGFLSIDAKPWAQVFVNGRLIGETPIDAYPVAGPTAEIRLVNPENSRQLTRKIRVVRGEKIRVKEDLR